LASITVEVADVLDDQPHECRVLQADEVARLAEPFQAAEGFDDLGHGFHGQTSKRETPAGSAGAQKRTRPQGPGKNGINSSFSRQLAVSRLFEDLNAPTKPIVVGLQVAS
jgi:hypothetical protein